MFQFIKKWNTTFSGHGVFSNIDDVDSQNQLAVRGGGDTFQSCIFHFEFI